MRRFLLFTLCCVSIQLTAQPLAPSPIFGDHMVLQRDQPIRIWGTAAPAARIQVAFATTKAKTSANELGEWMVELPALAADGKTYRLRITGKDTSIVYEDILLGDVWLCSGQSNMEWTVANTESAVAAIVQATDGYIRHFKVPRTYAETPARRLPEGNWQVASPKTVADFTAVGYYFAEAVRESVEVPIGLLHSSWGGSRIEAWLAAEAQGITAPNELLASYKAAAKARYEKAVARWQTQYPGLTDQDPGLRADTAHWAARDLAEKDWQDISVPGLWEAAGYVDFDGVAWYRTSFELSAAEAAAGVGLHLGPIDDSDITWVNGVKVGETYAAYAQKRNYPVPPAALRTGRNVLAVRVEDYRGGGGIYGEADQLLVQTSDRQLALAGKWQFRLGAYFPPLSEFQAPRQTPTILYNQMIYPLRQLGLRGILWYQGESNANNASAAQAYQQQFQTLIQSWRALFGQADLPFLYVQLANYRAPVKEPGASNWALLRESQTAALALPYTGQAVIIDLGEADDIHPRKKREVGQRLARLARRITYGQELLARSPTLIDATLINSGMLLTFDHVGEQLDVRNRYGYINGFAIAGEDKKFVWAMAYLERGKKVVVWSDKVSEPRYVRYGWADNPDDLNLYNSAGLPITPFRTDSDE